ncbi:hypothetical protein [Frigidibacter oleivorans]|uniref:hypothetical protein n=1 Tax=Frigidibacter oleivorans TaxID=2487129 RepID=UPI000F8D7D4D|nr:hypothetical protein [Frigidibacter oleivorans]
MTRHPAPFAALLLAAALAAPLPARASSEAAWETFRQEVVAACEALLTGPGPHRIDVNPFGSASYGLALVHVQTGSGDSATTETQGCIYDKRTKVAELTGPFAPAADDTAAADGTAGAAPAN